MYLSTLPQWLNWIASNHHKQIDLGLDRVKKMANCLNVLSFSCPVIVVGGTNGKGSTIACLEAIYREAGYQVGAFTSPVIFKHNEYLRINGKPVSDQAFCQAYQTIVDALEGISLTPFEFHALAAFLMLQQVFADSDKAVILLEVGLGGRLDAVNIIDADLSIVTNVSYDHCDYLGNHIEDIAKEKAGIFRKSQPAIFADENVPASLLDCADETGTNLYCLGKDFDFPWVENWIKDGCNETGCVININNAQAAVMAVSLLQSTLPVTETQLKSGLRQIKLIGRQEITQCQPLEIHDVAHNEASIKSLANFLRKHSCKGKKYAVFSMLSDKDIKNCVKQIQNEIDEWLLAPLQCQRAMPIEMLEQTFKALTIKTVACFNNVTEAYQAAKKSASDDDIIVVFGSFYTIAEVKK